jgi:putative transposase
MSLRRINLAEGEFYHVYNRGNSKQEIFIDNKDYDHFVKLLYLCNSIKSVNFREDIISKKIDVWDFERGDQLVNIGAWVLMPNHFHLYITPKGPSFGKVENSLSLFMRKICTAYTMYFNKKYNRTGSLFEGRFKSVHISDEVQARYLFSYVHLNPLKLINKNWKTEGVKDKKLALEYLGSYKWGSFVDYMGSDRHESKILNRDKFLNYFSNIEEFKIEIFDWISPKDGPLGM